MERESDPEKDRRDRSGQASTSRPLGEQRCCIGLTYFSQALHEPAKCRCGSVRLARRCAMPEHWLAKRLARVMRARSASGSGTSQATAK